ncbi:hypothetical protein XELAEV_18007691mg [Xenopus laevis]|uniref:Uncharacterized protein n=1 Tax=Xenopus laevis TaxID=8355 RepID=A0A974I5M9_XENLA|nr:hypothetical protein XELAEV_18007691mg [Xenopus laevis]
MLCKYLLLWGCEQLGVRSDPTRGARNSVIITNACCAANCTRHTCLMCDKTQSNVRRLLCEFHRSALL